MFFLPLLLAVSSAFAFNPQEGGGGNICVSAADKSVVLLDELYGNTYSLSSARRELLQLNLDSENLLVTDLTKLRHRNWIFRGVDHLASENKNLIAAAFERVFLSFSNVLVTENEDGLALEPDGELISRCEPGTLKRAFLSSYGVYQISRPLWNKLSGTGQRKLIVHEIVRTLQAILGSSVVSNRMITYWTSNLDERFYNGIIVRRSLFSMNSTLYKARKKVPMKLWKKEFRSLEEKLQRAVGSENLREAFKAYREIVLFDLATGKIQDEKPIYTNESYRQLVLRNVPLFHQ